MPRNWSIDELISRSGRRAKGRRVSNEAPVMFHHDKIAPVSSYNNDPEEQEEMETAVMTIEEYEEYSSA